MKKTTMPDVPVQAELEPVLGEAEITEEIQTEAVSDAEAAAEEDDEGATADDEINVPKEYLGKQQELYLYSRLAWANYQANLSMFTSFSQSYTAALATDQLAFITLTEAMADEEARAVDPLDAKGDLWDLNSRMLSLFKDGQYYIENTYLNPTKQATMLAAAGSNYYDLAYRKNWSSSSSLISAFKLFLTTYGDELIASNQMPPTFPDAFNAAADPFLTLWTSYKDKWKIARQERATKARNNNEIYRVMAKMCKVGYRKGATKEIKKKFTIRALYREVSGLHKSGLAGVVSIGGDKKLPIENARISVVGDVERFAVSNAMGEFELPLPSGEFTLLVEAPGFESLILTKAVEKGVMSHLNPAMTVAPPMPIQPAPPVDLSKAMDTAMEDLNEAVKE